MTRVTSESANGNPPRFEANRRRKKRKPHPARITQERVAKFSERDDGPQESWRAREIRTPDPLIRSQLL